MLDNTPLHGLATLVLRCITESERRMATNRKLDLSPLERYIREEDSRRAIARIRRRAAELLAQQSLAGDDEAPVPQVQFASPWLMLRRAAAWLRQIMAPPRTDIPPS